MRIKIIKPIFGLSEGTILEAIKNPEPTGYVKYSFFTNDGIAWNVDLNGVDSIQEITEDIHKSVKPEQATTINDFFKQELTEMTVRFK